MQNQELDLMILMGPFRPEIFYISTLWTKWPLIPWLHPKPFPWLVTVQSGNCVVQISLTYSQWNIYCCLHETYGIWAGTETSTTMLNLVTANQQKLPAKALFLPKEQSSWARREFRINTERHWAMPSLCPPYTSAQERQRKEWKEKPRCFNSYGASEQLAGCCRLHAALPPASSPAGSQFVCKPQV